MEIGKSTNSLIFDGVGTQGRDSLCNFIDSIAYNSVNPTLYYDVRRLVWDSIRDITYFGIYHPVVNVIDYDYEYW